MRELPQLKPVREDQGWSQRTLAAKSGVAQRTISQLERGERQAMPSTVRKLADALGVDPPVLMAESRIDALIPREQQTVEQQTVSSLPSEDRDRQRLLGLVKEITQGVEAHFGPESAVAKAHREFTEAVLKEEASARKEWYETGRGAEYYVSGEFEKRVSAIAETHDMSALLSHAKLGPAFRRLLSNPGEECLRSIRAAPRLRAMDLDNVKSRLSRNDPKETLQAAQLVSESAKEIVEEHASSLQSFLDIPGHYYADPAAHSRILKLEVALLEQNVVAGGVVDELGDLYEEILETLVDQINKMREDINVVRKELVRQQDSFVRQIQT